jgi:hypothetical protein
MFDLHWANHSARICQKLPGNAHRAVTSAAHFRESARFPHKNASEFVLKCGFFWEEKKNLKKKKKNRKQHPSTSSLYRK